MFNTLGMSTTCVLGGGLVGAVMAQDLARDPGRHVRLVDASKSALEATSRVNRAIEAIQADLSDPDEVSRQVSDADLVLGAMPSRVGFAALEAIIRAGKPFCDITFMAENAWSLDALARDHQVVAVVDCGVAPGMSNLLAGMAARRLDPCRSITIQVGGMAVNPEPPWVYKAAFSPSDVLEEYVRPARVVRGGRVCTVPALSDPLFVDFPGVGRLESFTTDGLRSLTETLDVPDMVERTMRFPGHRDLVWSLREAGLLSEEPIEVGGRKVVPRNVTAAAIFPAWTLGPDEADLIAMRVAATGDLDGVPVRLVTDLLDRRDPETGWTAMARTTGFPATIVARMIESGVIAQPGVYAPERLAQDDEVLETLWRELSARGVVYDERIESDA